MSVYGYQGAFGVWDMTSRAMRAAVADWFDLYYRSVADGELDPNQRIAYAVVGKLVRTVFAEYQLSVTDPVLERFLSPLDTVKKDALQLALVGGECYIKPCPAKTGFFYTLIPMDRILIFGRDPRGMPTDVGTAETSCRGGFYYTLLERRRVDEKGLLTIENRLYRSRNKGELGLHVSLASHPLYAQLPEKYTYEKPVGSVGLVRVKTPMLNCVDGSHDGVSVYAAAAGLIRAIDRNEAQMNGEFQRGQSRIIVSRDMLDKDGLTDHIFVGLDEDPERVGIHVFNPELREQSYLNRKQEYLRNVEAVIGLKRGMLSEVNVASRTATEVSSSEGEHNLTVMDFQAMWEQAVRDTAALCVCLGEIYRLGRVEEQALSIDWGNGVLFDEDKLWQNYMDMVAAGLLKPEIALGWRFNLPAGTEEERQRIRERFMPRENG